MILVLPFKFVLSVITRGLNHLQKKKRYGRGRSLPQVSAVSKAKSKNICKESNWDRYDQTLDNVDGKINSSTDFALLANVPIVQGSHFKFKRDKLLEESVEDVKLSKPTAELFKLDLEMLDQSISTIPFHVRNGVDEKYFSVGNSLIIDQHFTAVLLNLYLRIIQKKL